MLRSPVIVIGTPRSGTSIVTKWLIDNYDVKMCLDGFTDANEKHNGLYDTYEDSTVVACNTALVHGRIAFRRYKFLMKQFFQKMQAQANGRPWGFKDPRLVKGLSWIIGHFNGDLTIIRTKRKASLIIKSMIEKLGFTEETAVSVINYYELQYRKQLNGHHVISVYFDGEIKMPDEFVQSFDRSLSELQSIRNNQWPSVTL